jgi:hypothetical protein
MLLPPCAIFSDGSGSWWIPGVLLVVCVLCLHGFAQHKVVILYDYEADAHDHRWRSKDLVSG